MIDQTRNDSAGRRGGFIAALAVNSVILYAAHHLLEWGIPFITPSFRDVLWALNLSIGATIVANAFFIVYDAAWFRHVAQLGLDGLALLSAYTLYRVFPFDFEAVWMSDVLAVALLLTMVGIGIALVVQVVRMLTDVSWWQEAERTS
jgi:hypothetical protein